MFGVESDNAVGDFSPDDESYDETKDIESDSTTDASIDLTRKTATKRRAKASKTSSQVLQQNFDNMYLSFGMIPEYNPLPENEMQTSQNTESMQNDDNSNNRNEANTTAADRRDEFDFDLENLEDDEFSIDRQLRLRREQEEEEARANMGRRLLAPREEIRHRNRQPKKNKKQSNPESIDMLKEKQLKLLDLQMDYHKILIENAKVTLQKETVLLSQARSRINTHDDLAE